MGRCCMEMRIKLEGIFLHGEIKYLIEMLLHLICVQVVDKSNRGDLVNC